MTPSPTIESVPPGGTAQAFGWHRNHFDRFIHLIYGLCFTPAVWHWLRQRWPSLSVGSLVPPPPVVKSQRPISLLLQAEGTEAQ